MTLAPAEKPRDNSAKALEALLSKPILNRIRRDGPLPERKAPIQVYEPIKTENLSVWRSEVAAAAIRMRTEQRLHEMIADYEGKTGESIHGVIYNHYKRDPFRHRNLLHIFSKLFWIDVGVFKSPCKDRAVVFPRQVLMWILYREMGMSLPAIGRVFNRDHSTVLHAVKKIENDYEFLVLAQYIRDEVFKTERILFCSRAGIVSWPAHKWKFCFEIGRYQLPKAIKLAKAGYSQQEIADRLGVSLLVIMANWGKISK